MAQRTTLRPDLDHPPAAAATRSVGDRPGVRVAPTSAVTIRRGQAPDAVCVSALGIQVFLDTYATEGIRGSLAREATETLSPAAVAVLFGDSATTFILAETGGYLVGFAQLTASIGHALVPYRAPTELKRLYVQERFTGCGIGTMLLLRAERAAFAAGAAAVWLQAWSGNRRALDFYARRGYADLGPTPFTIEDERFENRLFARGR